MSFVDSQVSKRIVKEGAWDAVKIGAAETYFGAFGVFLGGAPLQIGALATLPPLIGSMSQVFAMRLAESLASRKAAVLRFIRMQAVVCAALGGVGLVFESAWWGLTALIALVSLYHITIGLIAPVWNSLVGDIVPAVSRGEFFGYRNKWMAIVTFLAVVLAGECIHLSAGSGYAVLGYAAVFLVAGVSRLWSARMFRDVPDVPAHVSEESKFTFWQFIARGKRSNFLKFVVFVSAMNFAASISGPYFAMYMLSDLKLSYREYMVVVAAVVLMQFAVMRSWGRLSDQFGNRKILKLCGVLVSLNPLLWLLSTKFWYVIGVQLYSGLFWAGFNLAAANFLFDAVTPAKRARCFAYQSIVNGVFVFLGSAVGGVLASYPPQVIIQRLAVFVDPSPFLLLFALSALLRVVAMVFLFPTFKEVRPVQKVRGYQILVRVVSLRPLWGATFGVVYGRKRRLSSQAIDRDA